MGKAQLAMWTLTKMAMLFFIIALGLIIMSFAGREKEALCSNRAQAVADGFGSALAQVINSPLEDERVIYPLEAVLTVGKSDYERYFINVTLHKDELKPLEERKPYFVIDVYTTSPGCSGGTKVGYYPNLKVNLVRGAGSPTEISIGGKQFEGMVFTPSKPDLDLNNPVRSKYIAIIRCQSKTGFPPVRTLFIQDCKWPEPEKCLTFYAAESKSACEWN